MSKTELYKACIDSISKYFGVTNDCASYLYHRSFRSKRKDDKYLDWNIKLQNAIVKVDKCMGIDWTNVYFGIEEKEFSNHGIIIDEMDEKVFRWGVSSDLCDLQDNQDVINDDTSSQKWVTVSHKKKKNKNNNISLIKRSGLYI